jgi:hypothetical protein
MEISQTTRFSYSLGTECLLVCTLLGTAAGVYSIVLIRSPNRY